MRAYFLSVYNTLYFLLNFSSGGAGKITIDKLESSLAQIKDMFKERANIIQDMTSATAPTTAEKLH